MSYVEKLARMLIITWYIVAFSSIFYLIFGLGKDSTDPPSGRSGMGLKIDYMTGCHYLAYSGLTPRLDAAGRHIGCQP